MNALRTSRSLILSAVMICGLAGTIEAGTAELAVQVDQPGVRISPTLYGIFFEEINCAGDGGLYAEMVRNRSFEDSDKPDHWSLVTTGAAKGELAVDSESPMNEHNRHALRLTIRETGKGAVGAANEGYWGMSLTKNATYELSFLARRDDGFRGPLQVSLSGPEGQTYAATRIEGLSANWQQFHASLRAQATDPKARLVISAAQPGTVWLDVVSLFPKQTFKGRPNGLRSDLAEMLSRVRPSFVRFPGGCWVEGDNLSLSYHWKQTIGDIAERRNQYNIWQYYSTQGLGFHEYLQMCEDLGAEPLFVINCGMSHRGNVPLDQMGPWVQDALDAIEYANGSVKSHWGSVRARNGHSAPFHLRYMEIGNENGGRSYGERYPLFYRAIKARYPEMNLIADVWGGIPQDSPVDIVDEHYYSNAAFFLNNASHYDRYDRHGPKVYVGEYAVTQGCGNGNLRAALGEAAFMTGLERNADVVVMASYAPLFANVNYKKWNPDLINFNSAKAYGTPSYYVQEMFSENRGDFVLPVHMQAAQTAPVEVGHGGIGLGTWNTQAEYKDLKVIRDSETLLTANFNEGSQSWRTRGGDWQVTDGAFRQTADGVDRRALAGGLTWRDYTYTLKARKLGGVEGFLIMFRAQDDQNWFWWNLGGWGNTQHAIEHSVDGDKSLLGQGVPGRIETGRWYDVRVELQGPRVRCYLDGKLIHDVTMAQPQPMYAVASRVRATGELILKVVNVAAMAQDTEIRLNGAKAIRPSGRAVVLTSANPADENTIDAPLKVAPIQQAIANAAANFRHTFPPNSVTVLRLRAAP
ncbi:MAG: alpha-L-arabinofuranosidase C-terminal domain-containing protein [Limisphaerales bacterium]